MVTKIRITRDDYRFDEDSLTLAEMGINTGDEIDVVHYWPHLRIAVIKAPKDIVIDGITAVYEGEEIEVTEDEYDVIMKLKCVSNVTSLGYKWDLTVGEGYEVIRRSNKHGNLTIRDDFGREIVVREGLCSFGQFEVIK